MKIIEVVQCALAGVAMLSLVVLAVTFVIGYMPANMISETEQVDCYDKYGNEIQGETCIREREYPKEPYNSIIAYSFLVLMGTLGIRVGWQVFEQ